MAVNKIASIYRFHKTEIDGENSSFNNSNVTFFLISKLE
ncbi:hypothetical protein LEP1GSC021_4530 [Leptospira noguchii str. 1993005606]|nr:hypothetical protein LEP1GSC021_4530 [Leptospira noguchii str. 1993005606]